MAARDLLERVRSGLRYFRTMPQLTQLDRYALDNQRIADYLRWGRWYEGYVARGLVTIGVPDETKKLKYNFCKPVVNIPAGWLAAQPLVWDVRNEDGSPNEEASDLAKRIWDQSGAERIFLEAALTSCLYGDSVIRLVRERDEETALPRLEFLCPDICYPLFSGHDHSELIALEIAYQVEGVGDEERYTRHEYYDSEGAEIYHGDELVDRFSYDALPAVWVRNEKRPGHTYGTSDLADVIELVDEYDHIERKETAILDYYATPRIVLEGVRQGDLTLDVNTVLYVPAGGKAYFLEWSGDGPRIQEKLTRVKQAISQISEIPLIAFGESDTGFTSISGIGMRILFEPLLRKINRKRAAWGIGLERAMWLALTAAGSPVPLPNVNVIWQDPTPQDALLILQGEVAAVAGGLKSKQTAMRAIGIEDPEAELQKIVEEQELLVPPEVKAAMAQQAAEGEDDRNDD